MHGIENIGVGQIELVLSIIFLMFSKILSESSLEAKESVEIFKTEFIGDAIKLGIKLILMNQRRKVSEHEEEVEKNTLSLAMVNFFKHVSKDNALSPKLMEIG